MKKALEIIIVIGLLFTTIGLNQMSAEGADNATALQHYLDYLSKLPRNTQPQALPPKGLSGRWNVMAPTGELSSYMVLSGSAARKSNAPEVKGTWKLVGKEAHITWSDGWKNIIRPGNPYYSASIVALEPGRDWKDKPTHTFKGVKVP